MLFSVIVPVYKVEKYLCKCVDSILNQSYENFELILVDDGSPDNCPQICDEYAKKDERVKVIHKENGGHTSARNAGLEIAKCEYVTFIDSDDYVAQDYLKTFADGIDGYQIDIACVGNVETDGKNEKFCPLGDCAEGYYDRKNIEKNLFPLLLESVLGKSFSSTLWGKAIKKDLIHPVLSRIDKRIVVGEDSLCVKACLYKAQGVFISNSCLYYYRQSPNSIIRTKSSRSWTELELRLNKIKEIVNLDEFDFKEQYCRNATHILFNVVASQFNREEKYSVIVKDIKNVLKNPEYVKVIKNCKTKDKKLRFARFALKYRMFWLIKLYNKTK